MPARSARTRISGLTWPLTCAGVDTALLDPRSTWADPAQYDMQAAKLVQMFSSNFGQYAQHIDDDVKAAAIS